MNDFLNYFTSGFETNNSLKRDRFRLFLDNGMQREIIVHSADQTPESVVTSGDITTIKYNTLTSDNGITYDVKLTVYVKRDEDNTLTFTSDIENNDDVRVNEIQLPFIDLDDTMCDPKEEKLYVPEGLGKIICNPRKTIAEQYHTEYMSADEHQITMSLQYPTPLSMSWFGLQAGNKFLYMAAHDEKLKICSITAGTAPRHIDESRLFLAVSHYPAVRKGECVESGKTVIAVFDGDWRCGSALYRKFADSTFNKPNNTPDWVKNMTGWQRIILKHQFGEIFFKYSDLPQVYKDGVANGINTLMVFGWWKGRFDNGYPEYECDPALGGEEELKAAIDEIHRLGGKVHLYTNGSLIDVKTDFYKNIGCHNCLIDIDGNEYRDHYRFSNEGTTLRLFGYKSFVTACHGTDAWKKQFTSVAKLKLSLGADAVFYDQMSTTSLLCFNDKHKHKNRVDEDPEYRLDNIRAVKEFLPEDHAIGSENAVDRFCSLLHYTHGCYFGMSYHPNAFPDMFRHTFPEAIISNRNIHDQKNTFRKHWNYAFVEGLIFDVCTNRGRTFDMNGYPQSAAYIKELIEVKKKYKEFFFGGKYSSACDLNLPENVFAAYYTAGNKQICVLCNNTDGNFETTVYGEKHKIEPSGYRVVERN